VADMNQRDIQTKMEQEERRVSKFFFFWICYLFQG